MSQTYNSENSVRFKTSKEDREALIEDLRSEFTYDLGLTYRKWNYDGDTQSWIDVPRPDQTIYTIIRHVSNSGMERVIDMFSIQKHTDGRLYTRNLSWIYCRIMESTYSRRYGGGVKVGGCGMDMCAHLVGNLSSALFGDYQVLDYHNI
jgi:hypothetical protein